MKKSLLILTTLFISAIGFSQAIGDTFIDNFITYEITSVTSNTVQVTDYNTAGGTNVSIPSAVTNASISYSVTKIGPSAFQYKSLTNVTIPNSITEIRNYAFRNNNLTQVAFPENNMNIQSTTFTGNPITNVISTNLTPTYLNVSAVFDNANTIDLTVPIGAATIYNTNWAGFASVTEAAPLVVGDTFINNYITYRVISVTPEAVETLDYNTAGGTVVNIPVTVLSGVTTYDVTNIKNLSFHQKGLTDITIPNSITFIGTSAFLDNNLTSVTIPNSITSIPSGVFAENQLTSVTIPDNILTIDNAAFQENQISTIVFGNNITTIGGCAFCFNQLANITIPETITEIGHGAFYNNQLINVTIPANVINIGDQAFRNNPLVNVISLAVSPPTIETSSAFPAVTDTFTHDRSNINLVIPNGTTDEYVTDNGALWTGFKLVYEITSTTPNTLEVTNYDAANGTTVIIPATITDGSEVYDVTEIGDAAFFDKGLTSVTIPSSVTSIGISSFNTNNLTSVTIPDSVTSISAQAFVTNDLTNVNLGSNLEIIGLGAFADNDLTSITFPNSVTEIGPVAFAANPLDNVVSLATIPPTITTGTNDTFEINGNRSGIDLTIPNGTENAYIAATWINFASVSLNITDFELANGVKVFTTANAIKVISNNSAKLENYTLYSISGAKVANGTANEIPTSYLAQGIYILKLDFDRGTATKKVIIK